MFGRVQYLKGFTTSEGLANQTPTSHYYKNQIKSKLWVPLTKGVIEALGPTEFLYCKVGLWYRGGYIDNTFINMFSKYFTNNNYFYLTGETGAATTAVGGGIEMPTPGIPGGPVTAPPSPPIPGGPTAHPSLPRYGTAPPVGREHQALPNA